MSETVDTTSKRIRRVSIRFSPSEIRAIMLMAQRAKVTFTEYVRRAALKDTESPGSGEYWNGRQWVSDRGQN